MKRSLLYIAFMWTLLTVSADSARAMECHPQKGTSQSSDKNSPEQGEPNLDGVVEVSFKIDNIGKVQILNINSTSPQLSEYVIKKLSKIQLEEGNSQIGKVIKYRFVFKKQA